MQMKKIFLAAISIVCLMASCTKDEMQADPINPNEGKEVVFSSSIGEATRTLYAEENGSKIAVKWVDGDLISVYGSTCAVNQSDYTVKAATGTETTDGVSTNYYYAESLTKTGDVGVQWGSEATSDFYAVYPSVGDNQFTKVDGGVKVQTTVRPKQNVTFTKTTATDGTVTWVGQHYNGAASNPTMTDAVMYAYTAGATSGKQVDLKFKPFSTVLRFTFKGYKGYQMDGENKIEYTSTVAVNKIVLTAPKANIAGDFELTINEDGASATQGTSNTIEIYPDYLPMKSNEQLQFDIFTIPTANVMPQDAEQAWKVQVVTEKGTFTFNLVPKKVNTPEDAPIAGLALTTGALHKLTIPLKTVTFDFDIPEYEWIRYIPRNVYLSELSLPGAWYATDTGYQSGNIGLLADTKTYAITTAEDGTESVTTTDTANGIDDGLEYMFSKGIRAFNIDCRLTIKAGMSVGDATGSWYSRAYVDNESHVTDGTLVLACSGTEGGLLGSVNSIGMTVSDALVSLGKLAAANPKEFIEVIITVAEKPKTQSGYTYGTINSKMMAMAIANVLNSDAVKGYVYSNGVTPDTMVGDVLGKMLVKVNMNTSDANIKTFAQVAPMLISEGSMVSDSGYVTSSNYVTLGNFTTYNDPTMYWSNSYTPAKSMKFYYHQCQNTRDNVTTAQRQTAVKNVILKSNETYSSNAHNALFQLGIGGWTDDTDAGKAALSATLNAYVSNVVSAMLAYDASGEETTGAAWYYDGVYWKPTPVGAVLMNFATYDTYSDTKIYSAALVEKIRQLNTKFYLNRNHGADEWPNDDNPFETGGTGGVVEENPET